MADMVKGFFLLILLIVGAAAAYASWLVLLPVSEADAEFRIAHVCMLGQLAGSALNGPSHRPVSCDCMEEGLRAQAGVTAMAKGADAIRQMFVAQVWSAANGEKPGAPDKTLMADRDVLNFIATLHRLDKTCAISPFSAAAR
jgi:hypothetical protein